MMDRQDIYILIIFAVAAVIVGINIDKIMVIL